MKVPSYPRFSVRSAFALADRVLANPPAQAHIRRVAGRGLLIKRFVLPLEVCLSSNTTGRAGMAVGFDGRKTTIASWQLGKLKRDAFVLMWVQNRGQVRPAPLPGRPMVRCVRFSSTEPDVLSDWAKIPVDRLTSRGTKRLRFLRDDRPKTAEIVAWWEPAPRGMGAVLIEVWSGEYAGAGASDNTRLGARSARETAQDSGAPGRHRPGDGGF